MHLPGLLPASAFALLALVSCGKPPAVEPAASPTAAATAEPVARGCSLRFTDIDQGRFEARLLCRGADRCRVLLNACFDKGFETPFVDGALLIGEDASNVAPCQVGMSGDLKCVGLDATKLIDVPEGSPARFRLSVPECNAGNQTPYASPKIARECAAHADDPLEQGVVFSADARGLVREWRGARVDDLQGLKAEAAREAERLAKEAEAEAEARRKKALSDFRATVDDFVAALRLGGSSLAYDWANVGMTAKDVDGRCAGSTSVPFAPLVERYFPRRLSVLSFPPDAACAAGAGRIATAGVLDGKIWRLEIDGPKIVVPEGVTLAPADCFEALKVAATNAFGAPAAESPEGASRCSGGVAHCMSLRWQPEDRGTVELGWDDATGLLSLVVTDQKLERDQAVLEERASRLGGKR